VLVASEDALDQFFAREPDALLSRRVEAAILDHANPRILDPHVLCAAFEAPLDDADMETLGREALGRAAVLPELERTSAGYVWKGRDYPAARISLRSGDGEAFTVVDTATGSLLGLVERERAYSTVHEGAVYLHLGQQYLVDALDLDGRVALVRPAAVDWYTQVKKETETAIEEAERVERRAGVDLHWGRVSVSEQVVAYAKKAIRDGSTIDVVPQLMPETTFETEAIWFSPEDALLEGLERMPTLLGTLHAAEHTLIALLPLQAMCDRWDIGGLSTNVHYQTGRPTIFVYDGHAGGVGITARGFERFRDWVEDAARLLRRCPCSAGCPSCVQSPKCGNLNDMLDKAGALVLLERMRDTTTRSE
jgi:DEAD/DEAH box helicase domain-containing protein